MRWRQRTLIDLCKPLILQSVRRHNIPANLHSLSFFLLKGRGSELKSIIFQILKSLFTTGWVLQSLISQVLCSEIDFAQFLAYLPNWKEKSVIPELPTLREAPFWNVLPPYGHCQRVRKKCPYWGSTKRVFPKCQQLQQQVFQSNSNHVRNLQISWVGGKVCSGG